MMRIVRLYGGLALHPKVNDDALIFALLHETGHLLASGRRFASDPMLACDCEADKWAISEGAEILHRRVGLIAGFGLNVRSREPGRNRLGRAGIASRAETDSIYRLLGSQLECAKIPLEQGTGQSVR